LNSPFFPAKLLLFGEYSIVIGGRGLAVPLPLYGGTLGIATPAVMRQSQGIRESNDRIRELKDYLQQLQADNALLCNFNFPLFEAHVASGLYFNATIPAGYGLGSSGSLCAAVYQSYAHQPIVYEHTFSGHNLPQLRSIFAQMEAFFHGASSGIDPLVCYLKQPLLISSNTQMETAYLATIKEQPFRLFLYDTGSPRPAHAHLVPLFVSKTQDAHFKELCQLQLNLFNNNCITALFEGKAQDLVTNFERLSLFQLEHFLPMIPDAVIPLWQQGLHTGQYYLKLCGAGGGGFMLGFSLHPHATEQLLGKNKVQWLEW